jgi:hypothetical protein
MITKQEMLDFLNEVGDEDDILIVDQEGNLHNIYDVGTKDNKKVIYMGDEVE